MSVNTNAELEIQNVTALLHMFQYIIVCASQNDEEKPPNFSRRPTKFLLGFLVCGDAVIKLKSMLKYSPLQITHNSNSLKSNLLIYFPTYFSFMLGNFKLDVRKYLKLQY